MLCAHLDGLDLVDGARAIGEIGEIFRSLEALSRDKIGIVSKNS
jgi:hypothetical protein